MEDLLAYTTYLLACTVELFQNGGHVGIYFAASLERGLVGPGVCTLYLLWPILHYFSGSSDTIGRSMGGGG